MTEELKYSLTNFNQLNFSLIPDAILLNRVEKKYLLNKLEFSTIINNLNSQYVCLEISNSIINSYYNTYFDTPNFDFYLQHHNNINNRLKIRKRYYKTTDTYFLEIKQKNCNRTFKNRMQINNANSFLNPEELNFITQHNASATPDNIKANVHINYKRLSLINKDFSERLSFDFDIEFVSNTTIIQLNNLIIGECKQIHPSKSHFINVIKQQNISQTPFSKYCIAISKLFPDLKHNNFKPQLTFLEQHFYDNAFDAVTN